MKRRALFLVCSLSVGGTELLNAQLLTLSADLGGHRSVYTGEARETYMPRDDGARVRPVAGPLLGLRLGMRLEEHLKEHAIPAHRLEFELRGAWSPELVAVRQAAEQVPSGQTRIQDYTGMALFLTSQVQLVVPGPKNASVFVGAGVGRLIRRGSAFEGTQAASRNGLALSIGVVPYVIKGFDQRAGLNILTDGTNHNFQLSFGVTTALFSRNKTKR